MLATGFAIGADRTAVDDERSRRRAATSSPRSAVTASAVDWRQFLIGLLFGLACTARLTMLFAAPFFVMRRERRQLVAARLVGRPRRGAAGDRPARRTTSITAGSVLHPAYDFLYQAEATYYPRLGYNLDWAIEDPRYIPQNLGIMLFSPPLFAPDTWPDSLRLTTDAFCTEPRAPRAACSTSLPARRPQRHRHERAAHQPRLPAGDPALRRFRTSRIVAGATIAVRSWRSSTSCTSARAGSSSATASATISCRWPSSSWRSVPRRLPVGRAAMPLVGGLVVASVLVNAWGVAWGNLLGW